VDIPTGALATEAVAEDRGVRLRLILERNPMLAGEPTWVATELTNAGPQAVEYLTDGCEIAVSVGATLTSHEWGRGVRQTGLAGEYKRVLAAVVGADHGLWLDMTPEPFLEVGEFGCADLTRPHRLSPGSTVRLRWLSTGLMNDGVLPPNAAVRLSASFDSWRPQGQGGRFGGRLEVSLDAWLAGGLDARMMSPLEAADFALTDPRFAGWIREAWPNRWQWIHDYDPVTRVWKIGLGRYVDREAGLGEVRIAVVDERSGRVVGVVAGTTDRSHEYRIIGPVQ
jgi:hypothetical protein